MNINFYESDGKLSKQLFDEKATEIAKLFLYDFTNRKGEKKYGGVSRNQLRKVFDEFKRLDRLLDEKKNWDEVFPMIKMIKSKVAYNVSRAKKNEKNYKAKKCYDELYEFVKAGIDAVSSREDYSILCTLFEAIYGFYYELGGVTVD